MDQELPNSDLQREMVFQQIKNPVSRELLRSSIPSHKKGDYELFNDEGHQTASKLFELVRSEGGNAFKYIFALAAAAQNPDQLSNSFATLGALQHWGIVYNRDANSVIDRAYDDFLRSTTATPYASDGARSIQGQIISAWNRTGAKNPNDEQLAMYIIRDIYKEAYFRGEQGQTDVRHWLEGYMLTVLDPNTPFALRKALIASGPLKFEFSEKLYVGERNPRFERNASFWKSVNASWVYPNLFGNSANGRDVKDWEIAGLRRTISDLQRQLEQKPQSGASNEQERQQLRVLIDRLQKVVKDNEEKLKVYKEIGQHPLDALGIGYNTWKTTPGDQRRYMVLKTYRERARKYHYQVPPSDPSFNPLLQELANREFTRLTNAYNYLNDHLGQNEF